MSLTVRKVVNRLRMWEPRNESDALRVCELPLHFLGEGAFRTAYSIIGTPLILKIPQLLDGSEAYDYEGDEINIGHAAVEYRTYRRILFSKDRAIKQLHPYMPDIYYFHEATGVTLMHRYELLRGKGAASKRREIQHLFSDTLGVCDADFHSENVGVDEHGKIKLLDLGCLEEWV